ncbi:Protein FAAH-1 a [Aphelenchoides avenae]|nr:Protein FAAH-1 a [Aphelenchus avenae]
MLIYALVVVTPLVFFFIQWRNCRKQKSQLRSLAERRRSLRQKQIEEVRRRVDEVDADRRRQIQKLTFDDLLEALQSGTFSCLEVLRAYQEAAVKAHGQTNCIALFITEAETWAKELDARAGGEHREKLTLYGLPVSIKECIAVGPSWSARSLAPSLQVKGYDQTRGYAQEIEHLAQEDALIVQELKELGAIPFVLTNVAQTIVTVASNNPIYGETAHPMDGNRSSGGSSAGEGALIACGGSIVDIGGDVAASIRLPAHACGIAGMKGTCPS